MSWVIWRQYRAQAAIAAALLAAFAALLFVTGLQVASQWHSALATCTADHTCGGLSNSIFLGSHAVGFLVIMTLGVPAILGMLLGAPLLAHEFESGTNQFAWAQSVTRRRWLAAKIGWPLLGAAVLGGAVSALVTWWSGPDNAQQGNAFYPGRFDIMGIVPVGYAVFAMAVGIAAGALTRRTVPAVGITLAVYIAVRFLIFSLARQHFMTAVTSYFPINGSSKPAGSYWLLSSGYVGAGGHPISIPQSNSGMVMGNVGGSIPVTSLPAQCQGLASQSGRGFTPASYQAVSSCATAHHVLAYITYQPASRYWAFQGIETGVFVALAAALLALTFIVVRRRDA
jgi:ABC-type transport system involved in multi-copper enzyme maturation permease subunit